MLQAVINRPNWRPGNSISVILHGEGTTKFGKKVIGSAATGKPPQLVIAYEGPLQTSDYLNQTLRTALIKEFDERPSATNMLLVEASASHWVNQTAIEESSFTTLQFLPFGAQLAMPNSPADYAPGDPATPGWMILQMPFLGRLQSESDDFTGKAVLQVDPLLELDDLRTSTPAGKLPSVALSMANRADGVPVTISVSGFDTATGRSFARLDPATLEEAWLRLQHPARENAPKGVRSAMAALTDTSARLSRAIALRQAFDPARSHYPPQAAPPDYMPPADSTGTGLVWRPDALMLLQDYGASTQDAARIYGWHLTGLQLATSTLRGTRAATVRQRHAAATLVPAWHIHDMPVSFAVSPYLGLHFRPGTRGDLRIVAAELLPICETTLIVRSGPIPSRFPVSRIMRAFA